MLRCSLRLGSTSDVPASMVSQAEFREALLQMSDVLTAAERRSVDSPDFWTAAYSLRRTAEGQVACPAFLQPLAQGILSTGKSLILLRARQGMHPRFALQPSGSTHS